MDHFLPFTALKYCMGAYWHSAVHYDLGPALLTAGWLPLQRGGVGWVGWVSGGRGGIKKAAVFMISTVCMCVCLCVCVQGS